MTTLDPLPDATEIDARLADLRARDRKNAAEDREAEPSPAAEPVGYVARHRAEPDECNTTA